MMNRCGKQRLTLSCLQGQVTGAERRARSAPKKIERGAGCRERGARALVDDFFL